MNRKEITVDEAAILFTIVALFSFGIYLLMSYYSVPNQIIGSIACIEAAIYIAVHRKLFKVKD